MTTTTSRRAILAGAAILPVASLPALSVPALASGATGLDHPDAELLRLGAQLEPIIHRWAAKRAVEVQYRAEWDAICERAGLPWIEIGDLPDDEWRAHTEKRWAIRPAYEEDETDENGHSVVWTNILDALNALAKDIISRKAHTVAGLTVQARAMTVYYAELWDGGSSDDEHNHDCRDFIEAVCAFAGVTPLPLAA